MWRTRSVFISSTFVDMQQERDFLRTRVFPELEERLQAHRCHLEWVDLRVGIALAGETEDKRELKVLKVCLDEVRRCRPYLIVLLGDRYGWIPPSDRISTAAAEQGLKTEGVAGRSVTDLEIELGIFANADQQARSFFYFRDPLPYSAITPEFARLYSDSHSDDPQAGDRAARLASLKRRVEEKLPSRVRHYQAKWDLERQRVTDLEDWGRMVLEDIWAELEAETLPTQDLDISWQEIERAALEDFIEDRARDFFGRIQLIAELEALAASPAADRAVWGCCISGAAGSGKSALFGAICRRLRKTGAFVLAHSAGASVRSGSVDSMLLRWIGELSAVLGVQAAVSERSDPDTIDSVFASLFNQKAARDRVVILVDALDQFENTPRGRFATWLPRAWPANARFLATAIPGQSSSVLAERVRPFSLPPLNVPEALRITRAICARYRRELDQDVHRALVVKSDASGSPWANPLWLVLAVEELNLLDADDFARAQRNYQGDPATQLRALMIDKIVEFPCDVQELFFRMFERAEVIFGSSVACNFLGLIAISRGGWRDSDFSAVLPKLTGETWDELRFASLRRLFRSQIRRRGPLTRWDVDHSQMRVAVGRFLAKRGIADSVLHSAVADHLLACSSDDPLRISETMVHLLGSGNRARAAEYYSADLSDDERHGTIAALSDHVLFAANPEHAARQIASLADSPNLDAKHRVRAAQLHVMLLEPQLQSRASLETRLILVERAAEVLEAAARRGELEVMTMLTLGIAQNVAAGLYVQSGRGDRGLEFYQAAIASAQKTNGDMLQNKQRDFSLARSWEGVGDISLTKGRPTEARSSFQQALAVREAMVAAEPNDVEFNLAAAVSLSKIGETHLAAADPQGALVPFRRCLAIAERLVAMHPKDIGLKLKLANYYERCGLAGGYAGDDTAALEALEKAYDVRDALAAADPTDLGLQSNLQASAFNIGEILLKHAPLRAAAFYEKGFSISQKLLAADPQNDFFLRGALLSQMGMGKCLASMGLLDKAIRIFRRCIEAAERLARSAPSNVVWQIDLVDAMFRAALCGDEPKARLASALQILNRLDAAGNLPPAARGPKAAIQEALRRLLEI
jgi:tetratricopeptide (TPR) repeat protein